MVDVDLDSIRRRLAAHDARRYEGVEPARWAAVAAVLREGGDGAEVLLMRRAEHDGDPWSGHMSFPGGHRDPGDPDLLATAKRETEEEVGIDLTGHELLGPLDEHEAIARGQFTGMVIAPYAFALTRDVPVVPNHEVAHIVWAPLGPMVRGELDTTKELMREGQAVRFPAFSVDGHVVWGLTHRMLRDLLAVLADRPLDP